jgi:NitT/TauT family transport system permease protein
MVKLKKIWPSVTLLALLIAIWWLVVVQTGSVIFPTPGQVVTGTLELVADGTLWEHIGSSLMRVGAGFLMAVVVAVPLGLWMGRVDSVYTTLNPVFQILRPISPIAWIPLAILWFGIGNLSPMFLIFLSSFFPLVVGTTAGVRGVERQYIRAAINFGITGHRLLRQVVVPAALPQIIVSVRLALGIAWLVVVAAEMIAIDSGLGYLIIDARNAGNRYDLVVAAMVMIGVIGYLMDSVVSRLERMDEVRWRYAR